ncbi:hypothetical protein Q3G72_000306 [Acer saccharum]|nr:hypothetical protein Q3G72_000306 [Acer saccharum]
MGPVVISVKFAGTQIEYNVLEPESYTLAALWADVYVMSYSNFPDPNEKFTTEAILPWNGQHRLIEDDRDLQDIFMVFRGKHLNMIRINMQLLQLSNAASFNGDLYAIFEDNSDDESQTKPYVPKPGKPFRVADDGKVGSTSNSAYKKKKKTINEALPQATQASQVAQTYQGAPISQPITHNAPLYSTAMLSQPCQSKSNPSTVAGLDVDWCGGLKVMMVDLVDAFASWIFGMD